MIEKNHMLSLGGTLETAMQVQVLVSVVAVCSLTIPSQAFLRFR